MPASDLKVFLEMPSSESFGNPYRKLTQVGKENILRCSGENWLRNSAK